MTTQTGSFPLSTPSLPPTALLTTKVTQTSRLHTFERVEMTSDGIWIGTINTVLDSLRIEQRVIVVRTLLSLASAWPGFPLRGGHAISQVRFTDCPFLCSMAGSINDSRRSIKTTLPRELTRDWNGRRALSRHVLRAG